MNLKQVRRENSRRFVIHVTHVILGRAEGTSERPLPALLCVVGNICSGAEELAAVLGVWARHEEGGGETFEGGTPNGLRIFSATHGTLPKRRVTLGADHVAHGTLENRRIASLEADRTSEGFQDGSLSLFFFPAGTVWRYSAE
jgi:hypothetical protein